MWKIRLTAALALVLGTGLGYYVYQSEVSAGWWGRPFRLGLDLAGGSHLVYEADVSGLPSEDIDDALESLKEVIERRVNVFGVTEPLVQVEQTGLGSQTSHRLIVELPGVTDLEQAVAEIDRTPSLEFKTERPDGPEKETLIAAWDQLRDFMESGKAESLPADFEPPAGDPFYVETPLTGRFLKGAQVVFDSQGIGGPAVSLEFDVEGADLFAEITKANVGKAVAIYLDDAIISSPVVREEIRGGRAEISGNFTLTEAKELARDLNLGALPVPIELVATETVGATLGREALERGIWAGLLGLLAVAIFMTVWYRLPGLVAVVALALYVILNLALYKLVGVTLTAAGLAGFILSLGLAVDANILIFERLKEEMRAGKHVPDAIRDGFARAWPSIRDSNFSSLISAVVLFWLGTSLIRGFALTLSLGILVSMFTAIVVTRVLMISLGVRHKGRLIRFLFNSGFHLN